MKTYLLVDAETREPIGDYEAGEANTLQVGTHIVSEVNGNPRKWVILATVEGEDERPIALVRPAVAT